MHSSALKDLLLRYFEILKFSWQKRQSPIQRDVYELAFLPAALELQESPPHPAARITLYTLISLLVIALLWSIFGKVDIVAIAPGKLLVSNQSKVIQPLEAGVVKVILVKDGQRVKAGQLLIELDSTITFAESNKNQDAWLEARLDQLKSQALLAALERRISPVMNEESSLSQFPQISQLRANKSAEMLSSWQELLSKLATLDADSTRKQAERAGVQDQVKKLEQTLPIVRQRESDFKELAAKNFISKHGALEKEQARIEAEQDLASQRNKLKELAAGMAANGQQRESIKAEYRSRQNELLAQANEKVAAYSQELIKANQHQKQTQLTAPVAGVVQQLAVHTIGGVVTAAQALMVIVPQADQLEAQVVLENKDIGFVNAGQAAAIKVETFNYTKYGLLDGRVENVSLDAIPDEKLGLVYQARVKLNRSQMNIDGKQIHLAPGMAVSVEIKTGQRRIIEYFLSPLIAHVSESVRER